MKSAAVLAAFVVIGSAQDPDPKPLELESPAPAGSAQPNLSVMGDGRLILSWLERTANGHRFRFSIRRSPPEDPRASPLWTPPVTIAEGNRFFVNWADVPSVVGLAFGGMAAHWLQTSGPGKYSYDVMLSHSTDEGRTWSAPTRPHDDDTETEHGFASVVPREGGFDVVWLDGRDFAKHGGGHGEAGMKAEMALRATTVPTATRLKAPETIVDSRVCECCPTAAVRTSRGVIAAYRDRSPKEVRDIAVVRLENGKWTESKIVHADNWQIPGCPVNGPALAASESRVALAWFSAADNRPHVSVAFSNDAGATFGPAVRVDDGLPLGRVSVALLEDGSAMAGWLEYVKDPAGKAGSGAEFRARRVRPDGSRGDAITVARVSAERASGYPRLARSGSVVTFAWVADDRVKLASLSWP
jgi:hypothetical protein